MANPKLIVEVAGDARQFDKTLRGVETRSQLFARRLQGTAGGRALGATGIGGGVIGGVGKAGLIGAGVAAGTAVALKGIQRVISAAEDAQVAQANLDQAFKATGVSAAKNMGVAEDAIQRVSKAAAFDDEEVSRNFASLLRTTGSLTKATKDVSLAANIARARRISLAAATKVVEKAENGQLRGLRALGVQIDKNTTTSEALDRAQQKFAGSAEAYGKTAAGAQEKYKVALENVEERIGAKLLPLQTKLALAAVRFLDWADKNWPRFARAIGNAYRVAKPYIDQTIGIIKGVANEIAGVVRIVHGIFTGDWAEAWKGFKQFAVDGVAGVAKAVASLPLTLAKSLGKAAFAQVEKAFYASLNRLIDILNKAIGAYNKIPLLPNIPKIAHVGEAPKQVTSSVPTARPDEGTRRLSSATVVDVYLDGKKINTNQAGYQAAAARRNPPQRRGQNAGRVAIS